MNASEKVLIEILAQIQLRILAKRQSGITKSDSVNQQEPDDKDSERKKPNFSADNKDNRVKEKSDTSG